MRFDSVQEAGGKRTPTFAKPFHVREKLSGRRYDQTDGLWRCVVRRQIAFFAVHSTLCQTRICFVAVENVVSVCCSFWKAGFVFERTIHGDLAMYDESHGLFVTIFVHSGFQRIKYVLIRQQNIDTESERSQSNGYIPTKKSLVQLRALRYLLLLLRVLVLMGEKFSCVCVKV